MPTQNSSNNNGRGTLATTTRTTSQRRNHNIHICSELVEMCTANVTLQLKEHSSDIWLFYFWMVCRTMGPIEQEANGREANTAEKREKVGKYSDCGEFN